MLRNYFYVVNCQSILIGNPTVEILEGLEEIDVTVKPDKILPRAQNCAKEVPGGKVRFVRPHASRSSTALTPQREIDALIAAA